MGGRIYSSLQTIPLTPHVCRLHRVIPPIGGFHKWSKPQNGWMVYEGNTYKKMDDDNWGYPDFRKLPFVDPSRPRQRAWTSPSSAQTRGVPFGAARRAIARSSASLGRTGKGAGGREQEMSGTLMVHMDCIFIYIYICLCVCVCV